MRANALVVLLVLLPCACSTRDAQEELRVAAMARETVMRESLLHEFDEETGLLAVKYGVDTAVVRRAVYGYLPQVDPMYSWLVEKPAVPVGRGVTPARVQITALVDSLAAANGIPKEKLAALLLDLRAEHRMERAAAMRGRVE